MTSPEHGPESAMHRPESSNSFSIARALATGTGWTIGGQLAIQGIGLLSTGILAWLLVPADFGLVAVATTLLAAIQTFSEFSFDVALIQNPRAGRPEYNSAWTLSVCRNTLAAIVFVIAASLMASSFGDPRLQPIIYYLAIGTFIDGFQNIGVIDFRKHLQFHHDLLFRVACKLSSFLVTLPLAFLWRNYWALVIGIIVGAIFRVILSFAMHSYRPRLSLAAWASLVRFSKWLVLSNCFIFVSNRASTLIISGVLGPAAVGVFLMSSEIAGQITSNLLAPMRRALFPGYAKIASDLEHLRRTLLDVSGLVFLIGTPATLGIGLVADPLVRIALGPNWLAAIPVIQVLALSEFVQLLTAAASPIYIATGRPQYTVAIQGIRGLAMVVALLLGIQWAGILGAACGVVAVAFVVVTVELIVVFRVLDLSASPIIAAIWRPLVAAAVLVTVVVELQSHWRVDALMGTTLLLAACVIVGAVTYSMVVFLLWIVAGRPRGAERHMITILVFILEGSLGRLRYMLGWNRSGQHGVS